MNEFPRLYPKWLLCCWGALLGVSVTLFEMSNTKHCTTSTIWELATRKMSKYREQFNTFIFNWSNIITMQKLQLFWILSLLHWLNEIILFYLIVICQTQGHLPTPTPQTHSFGDKKKLNRFIVVAVCLSHVGSYSMSIMRTILPRIVIAFECLVLQIIIADCLLHKSF